MPDDIPAAPLIEVTNLTKRYAERLVLDGVCLSVGLGETVTLVGPSGGGKSTLLRCINAMHSWDGGEVRVGDYRMTPVKNGRTAPPAARDVRRLVGMVFQDYQLFPHLSALANVIEAPRHVLGMSRADAVERAQKLLARVGLADRAEAYPQELSGGQQQRVAIARALAMEPRALLCDEITSALDPELTHEVLAVLEGLKRDGLTLLMVTHEMAFARRAADRVVVLADGRIVEQGPPAQVFDAPRYERTRQFLARA